jgi:hypothetical protein
MIWSIFARNIASAVSSFVPGVSAPWWGRVWRSAQVQVPIVEQPIQVGEWQPALTALTIEVQYRCGCPHLAYLTIAEPQASLTMSTWPTPSWAGMS